jgi:glycosyltransferase involved in cell wall biosynthesis
MVVGPVPPPFMGPSVGTQVITAAFERAGARVISVNTQDRRNVFNTGVFDARNVVLGLCHAVALAWRALRHPVGVVYIPISQGRWGYIRDAVLMTIARVLRRPFVVHLRGSNLQRFYSLSTRLERAVIRRTLGWSARAIALTPSLRTVYAGLVPDERVRVLENAIVDPWPAGVDHLTAVRAMRAKSSPHHLRILFIANDFAMKGGLTVIRALADATLARASLRLIGDASEELRRTAEMLAFELGVAERVVVGRGCSGSAKWREFEWADVFAYPSENDGQPIVVIEAMAAGLPIVTSRCGGIPETVGDAAIVIDPRNPADLARELHRLIDEPQQRIELGRAARLRFVSHYTVDAFQARFERLFGELLDLPATGTRSGESCAG